MKALHSCQHSFNCFILQCISQWKCKLHTSCTTMTLYYVPPAFSIVPPFPSLSWSFLLPLVNVFDHYLNLDLEAHLWNDIMYHKNQHDTYSIIHVNTIIFLNTIIFHPYILPVSFGWSRLTWKLYSGKGTGSLQSLNTKFIRMKTIWNRNLYGSFQRLSPHHYVGRKLKARNFSPFAQKY